MSERERIRAAWSGWVDAEHESGEYDPHSTLRSFTAGWNAGREAPAAEPDAWIIECAAEKHRYLTFSEPMKGSPAGENREGWSNVPLYRAGETGERERVYREALEAVVRCEARFSLDPLEHANNAVEHCRNVALAALRAPERAARGHAWDNWRPDTPRPFGAPERAAQPENPLAGFSDADLTNELIDRDMRRHAAARPEPTQEQADG